jgi:hypothetical protein
MSGIAGKLGEAFLGDVLIIPDCDPERLRFHAPCRRQLVGRTAVLTFDNRCPPQQIVHEDGLVVAVGAPLGDVGALGGALLRGDLEAAKAAALALDGHFAVFAISPGRIAAVTDPAGSIPIYYADAGGRLLLGTRVNEVADAAGAAPDIVSVYDFAIHRCICHPHTWFSNVFLAEPSTILSVDGGLTQTYYWTPSRESPASLKDAANALREQMAQAATQAAEEKVGLLMSSGEDSRAVASFLPPERTHGYIFLNAKNREWMFADLAARVLGFPLTPLIRDDGAIAADLDQRQRFIGYGYDVMQGHVFPFKDMIQENRLVGGWTSDTLFKGYFLRPRNGRFPKRGPGGHFEGPAADALRQRYLARYAQIEPLVPAPTYEWMRVWPLSAHPHFAHYATARRYFDHREPYFYAKTYRLSASISARIKFSRKVFYEATNPQLGIASWLPTGRGTVPALNGEEVDFAKMMTRWHDKHVNPGVSQAAWGRSIQIKDSPRYPEIATGVERAIAEFDGGRLATWAAERAAELQPGKADPLLASNRLVQIGLALDSARLRTPTPEWASAISE